MAVPLSRALLIVLCATLLSPASSFGFEKWDPYEPPPLDCGYGPVGLTIGTSGCLQLSGWDSAFFQEDTASGATYGLEASGRAAFILDENSGAAAVLGAHAFRFPYTSYYAPTPDGYTNKFEINEAFGTVGTDGSFARAGLLDATFDTLAAKTTDFEWLTDLAPFQNYYGTGGEVPLGGLGVQIVGANTSGFTLGGGVENLDGHAPDFIAPFDRLGMAGTAIAFSQFESGSTEARGVGLLEGVRDGQINGWNFSAFSKTSIEQLDFLASGTLTDELWSGTLSSRLHVDSLSISGQIGAGSDWFEFIGSAHLGDNEEGSSIGIAGHRMTQGDASVWNAELQGTLLASDTVLLRASLGRALSLCPTTCLNETVDYLRLGLSWQPRSNVQVDARFTRNSLGGAQVTFGAFHRIAAN